MNVLYHEKKRKKYDQFSLSILKSCDTRIEASICEEIHFPRNLTVYNLIANKGVSLIQSSPKQISSLLKPKEARSPLKSPYNINSIKGVDEGITKCEKPIKAEKKYESEIKKPKYQIEHPIQGKQLSYSSAKEKPIKVLSEERVICRMCPEHNKPMEIVCRDDKLKICSSCALFGSHKNHNVCSEEQLICEITGVAEKILELFEIMEKKGNERDSFHGGLKTIMNKTKEEAFCAVRDHFEVNIFIEK